MKRLVWEDVVPYLTRARRSHDEGELRAERIAEFVRLALRYEHLEVQLRGMYAPGSENGSCTQFHIYLDENWSTLPADRFAVEPRYTLHIAVSERGPFVVSSGYEWSMSPADWAEGKMKLLPLKNSAAKAKAEAIALAVAHEFDLRYVDAEWLRQFRLDPNELTDDGRLSLDYSEPDALNVMFDETL